MIELILFLAGGLIFACFVVVLAYGAPYLPTLKPQIETAFELLDLPKGATLLELGSGDGRVLEAAAERGYRAIGIELNPLLVIYSRWRTRHNKDMITVRWGNFWKMHWPACDGVFVFLLDRYMERFDAVAAQMAPLRVASFAFQIPHKQAESERQGVYLYVYKKPKNKRRTPSKT